MSSLKDLQKLLQTDVKEERVVKVTQRLHGNRVRVETVGFSTVIAGNYAVSVSLLLIGNEVVKEVLTGYVHQR